MRKIILPALFALGLTACAAPPTPFVAAQGPQGLGYSDERIEQDRYRVTYRGTDHPGATAEDLALLHAADIALAQGFDWFRVVTRSDSREPSGPIVSVGAGEAEFGRHSAVGLGVGTSFDIGGLPLRSVTLEVLMAKGTPPHESQVYDAHDAAKTIRARL